MPPLVLPTKSKDQSTRLFSPENIDSVKISYVSKIKNVCALPAGAFSEPKIATLCSFGTDNSSCCVFDAEFKDCHVKRIEKSSVLKVTWTLTDSLQQLSERTWLRGGQ